MSGLPLYEGQHPGLEECEGGTINSKRFGVVVHGHLWTARLTEDIVAFHTITVLSPGFALGLRGIWVDLGGGWFCCASRDGAWSRYNGLS